MRNVEYLVLCGDRAMVQRASAAVTATNAPDLVH